MTDTCATGNGRMDELLARAAKRDARLQEMLGIAKNNSEAALLLSGLSDREYQVFWLLLGEERGKEIARQLSISQKTVDTHKTAILRKFGLDNRISLVRWAIRKGVIEA
jgi:DNA-binding CsgD family transcriptional regulator